MRHVEAIEDDPIKPITMMSAGQRTTENAVKIPELSAAQFFLVTAVRCMVVGRENTLYRERERQSAIHPIRRFT